MNTSTNDFGLAALKQLFIFIFIAVAIGIGVGIVLREMLLP